MRGPRESGGRDRRLLTNQNIRSNLGPHLVNWYSKNNPRYLGINKYYLTLNVVDNE